MAVRSHRRPLALAAAVATAAALGATALATTTASAAEVPLSGYELTWGIKQSYRTYVTGFAAGSFTATDGASQAAGNGAFTFTEGAGTYDSTAHTLDLGFRGGLKIESTAHRFELTLTDVRFDSGTAEITADVTRSGTTTQDVPLADVTVTRSMTDMATTLTQEAADVLGSASYAGAAGDPLTVVQKTQPSPSAPASPSASASPSAPASPSTSASPSASASPSTSASPSAGASPSSPAASPSASASPSTQAPARGDIVDGTLGWGVKQSFRTYVVDGVAKGAVTTSGGASQAAGNGVFTFVDAKGEYDTEADSLTAAFEGAVNFKGHEENGEYGLDLTLTGLEATLDDGAGELTADVTSLGETSEDVVLAELKADSAALTAKNDVITVDDITATLTDAGAEAFGGFYAAGSELDPVDLSVALTEDAELPDGDGDGDGGSGSGGGSGTTGGTGSTTGGTGSTTGGITGGLAATGSDVPAAALGTAAAITVAAGAGVVLAMRRRRTAE
ncbi:HtaA domain-containing protein [Streptomyces sp. NPDC000983]|uniref:HtaA domain-containing protein n=1 Tax=Streptomyces sp. NPDC000983 TaxID=3154373 RepID=UPI00331A92D5